MSKATLKIINDKSAKTRNMAKRDDQFEKDRTYRGLTWEQKLRSIHLFLSVLPFSFPPFPPHIYNIEVVEESIAKLDGERIMQVIFCHFKQSNRYINKTRSHHYRTTNHDPTELKKSSTLQFGIWYLNPLPSVIVV